MIERIGTTVLRMPSISIAPDGMSGVVAGSDIQRYDDEPIPPRPLILLDLDGHRIEPPPGDFQFVLPRVVLGPRSGEIHLAWAEATPQRHRLRREWISTDLMELWYAHYRPDAGWTVPEKLHEGTSELNFGWGPQTGGQLMVEADGTPHVIVSELRTAPSDPSVFHYVRREREWQPTVLAQGMAATPNVVKVGSELVAAYVSPTPSESAQDLMVLRSTDGGDTWSESKRAARASGRFIPPLRLLAGGDDVLRMVWLQFGTGESDDTVKVVTSADHGRTWSAPEVVATPPAALWMDAAVDACGTLHVTYQIVDIDDDGLEPEVRSHLWHAWYTGSTRGVQTLFPTASVDDYALTAGPDGLYVWAGMRPSGRVGDGVRYSSALMRLRYSGTSR